MRIFNASVIFLAAFCGTGSVLPALAGNTSTTQQEASSKMPADRFWELIGRTTGDGSDPDRQLEALRQVLRELTAPEIEAFERSFQEQQRRAYSWDLWGAAYVINGGASDDGFEYFRRWLVSKGRTVFEAALADPDMLAEIAAPEEQGDYEFESFAYIASDIWKEKTGIDPLTDQQGRFPFAGEPLPPEPLGVPFEEDPDHLAKRYPKLWARFGMQ